MNPRVSPCTKNVALIHRKNVGFRNLNGAISSHIKDGDKVASANYDLSHLDVVPSAVKSTSPKTKHVHFFSDKTLTSPRKATSLYGNSQKDGDFTKRDYSTKRYGGYGFDERQKRSSSGSVRNDEHSVANDLTPIKTSKKTTSAWRSYSLNVQNDQPTLIIQRSQSLTVEETNPLNSTENNVQINRSIEKQQISIVKPKVNRSLPATPSKTAKPSSTAPAEAQRPLNHKATRASRKDSGSSLSVRFADSVFESPNLKDKSKTNKIYDTNTLFKNNSQNIQTHAGKNQKIYSDIQKRQAKTESYVIQSRVHFSNKLEDGSSHHNKECEYRESFGTMNCKDSIVSKRQEFGRCTSTKYATPSSLHGTVLSSSEHFIGQRTHSNQLQNDANLENLSSTNLSSNTNVSSASLKPLNQLKNSPRSDSVQGNSNSILIHTPSSLNKEVTPPRCQDIVSMTLTPISKFPHYGTLPGNLKQISLSSVSSASTTSARPHKPTSRQSSCLGRNCVFGKDLDYVTEIDLAQQDNHSVHSSSPALLDKHQDTTLSETGPFSSALCKKRDHSSLTLSGTKCQNLTSTVNKESIAASYQLERCWFCGRPMPTFGTSLSSGNEHLEKLAKLELLLAQAQSEKIKLVEEQVKMKESEMKALQKSEDLERELKLVKLRETKTQTETQPTARCLQHSDKEFDLRSYIESSGHQLDMCSHVVITSHSCRGFLHKMGSRFKTWKKRWFVLDRIKRMVFYFTDKTESKLKGSVCFQEIQEVYVDHLQTVKSPNPKLTFCVKTYEKTYYLVAPSSDTMTIWIEVLFTAAEGCQQFYDNWQQE